MKYLSDAKEIKVVGSIEEVNSMLATGNWKLGKILEGKQSIEFLMLFIA